jgi:amidase
MTTHHFSPVHFHNTIGSHVPAMVIDDGDTVITETIDAHGIDRLDKKRADGPNPMTGPFFVSGAEPGDALLVRIERITISRSTGWTFQVLSPNVVDPAAVRRFPSREKTDWVIDLARGTDCLKEPPASLCDWSVAVKPMIGCFGVAPAMGQAISTATSGPFGGNMDYRHFGAGIEAIFPVFASGGLFFLGDVHAAQGDGEIVGTGIEATAEVQFTVEVQKKMQLNWPRGRSPQEIFTIGNARPLDQALQHATTEMLGWLIHEFGFDEVSASHVMGQAARYDIANVFNPAYSVACRIAKSSLASLRQF